MKDLNNDLKARLTLPDGRQVWRDGQGSFFDVGTDQMIALEEIQEILSDEDAVSASRRYLIAAVKDQGSDAKDVYDAWGQVVGVQAQIALGGDGAKATAAAKFVAQAVGLDHQDLPEENDDKPQSVLGRDLAVQVLGLVEKELENRKAKDRN